MSRTACAVREVCSSFLLRTRWPSTAARSQGTKAEPPHRDEARSACRTEGESMTGTFTELGVSARVRDTLAKRGVVEPFAVQTLVLEDAIAGRDVLARSATGSGKTLAFAIPIIETVRPQDPAPSALVLVPTRELAQQVADEFADIAKAQGLRVGVAYGGVSIREQAKRNQKAHVLIATPGRLQDLVERGSVRLDRVRILVLDEADRMLDVV